MVLVDTMGLLCMRSGAHGGLYGPDRGHMAVFFFPSLIAGFQGWVGLHRFFETLLYMAFKGYSGPFRAGARAKGLRGQAESRVLGPHLLFACLGLKWLTYFVHDNMRN